MFTKAQEEYLLRRLNRNDVILFLGAGFSFDAENSLGERLPLGKTLSQKIWEAMYAEPFIDYGTSLQDMYQVFLKSGISFDKIKQFLSDNLLVRIYPDYYKFLTHPYWYKIYTVNIDNLLDKVIERWGNQTLDTIKYPNGEFKERDQMLDYLQVVYLHGKLPCNPDEVVFSRAQYASASTKLQPLYFHFINEYANQPTVFIGTSLDEQLFDQYIATRQSIKKDTTENRPKSFLITPSISPIREKVLKNDYNIEVVNGTTKDFMLWIESQSANLLSREEIIRNLIPTLDKLLKHPKFKDRYSNSLKEFAQSFNKVELDRKFPTKKKNYLLGSTPTWSDIHYGLDAPRKITKELFTTIEGFYNGDKNLQCIAILGTAGSGKSTVLKRLCYQLASNGRSVYHSHSESLPFLDDLAETLEMIDSRVVIAIDNAELMLKQLVKMVEELNKIKHPPIFILASRTNVFERVSSKYERILNLKEYEMPNLDRDEIVEVIKKLDENNVLGHLKGLKEFQRIKEFEQRAKKQILVAMREATEGKDFEDIMKSEFEDIGTEEGKILCLCTALATDAGFTIAKQDFTSFSAKSPSEALDILERNLKGLILKVGIKEDRLLIRHRMIADFFIESCVSPDMLKQAYIRVLTSLASEINNKSGHSRKFALYIEIINHYKIYKRFFKDMAKAREVYESLSDYFRDDFQFWLQYGCLELEGVGGDLELADNYLNQAYSLNEENVYVRNAMAHLYYKKSLETSSKGEADRLKEEADSILFEIIKDRFKDDAYTYHIYGKGYYNWILRWLRGPIPIRTALLELQKVIEEGYESYPSNKRLKELREVVSKAILLTAVNTDNVTYPVLYSEFGN